MKTPDLRCYDNGGKTFDRYTILPPRWARAEWQESRSGESILWHALGASEHPFHPQGFGQHTRAVAGPHLGARTPFGQLPADVQRFARDAFDIQEEKTA